MALMRAAERFHQRPSVMILGKDSRKKRWTRTDIVLAKAYERFLAEMCPQCGLPKYICHTDDNAIQFKVRVDVCQARALAEKAQTEEAEAYQKNPATRRYGRRHYAEPYLIQSALDEGKEFSDFRRPYLIEEAKRRGLVTG